MSYSYPKCKKIFHFFCVELSLRRCGCREHEAFLDETCVKCSDFHLSCPSHGTQVFSAQPLKGYTRLKNETHAFKCLKPDIRCDADHVDSDTWLHAYLLLVLQYVWMQFERFGSQKFWFRVRPYPSRVLHRTDAASARMLPHTMVPPLVPAEKVTLMSCVWTVPQSIFPVVINVNDAMIVPCFRMVRLSWWQQSWWFLWPWVWAFGFGCIATDMQKYGKAQVRPVLWRSSWGHRCQSFCSYVTRWWQSVYSYNIM